MKEFDNLCYCLKQDVKCHKDLRRAGLKKAWIINYKLKAITYILIGHHLK